jgi:hypothetical protein
MAGALGELEKDWLEGWRIRASRQERAENCEPKTASRKGRAEKGEPKTALRILKRARCARPISLFVAIS